MTSPREIAESYWAAECRRDLGAVLDHYHPDAVVHPPSGPVLRGHEAIATFYADEIRDYPGLEVEIVHEVSSGDEASLEWEAVLTDHDGRRHPFRGVNIVQTREGRFVSVRAYFDPTAVDPTAVDTAALDTAALDTAALDTAAVDPAAVDPPAIGHP